MDEHLAAGQIAEFILGGLDEDELEEVYRHVDLCGELVGGRVAATSESRERGRELRSRGLFEDEQENVLVAQPHETSRLTGDDPVEVLFPRAR